MSVPWVPAIMRVDCIVFVIRICTLLRLYKARYQSLLYIHLWLQMVLLIGFHINQDSYRRSRQAVRSLVATNNLKLSVMESSKVKHRTWAN